MPLLRPRLGKMVEEVVASLWLAEVELPSITP